MLAYTSKELLQRLSSLRKRTSRILSLAPRLGRLELLDELLRSFTPPSLHFDTLSSSSGYIDAKEFFAEIGASGSRDFFWSAQSTIRFVDEGALVKAAAKALKKG